MSHVIVTRPAADAAAWVSALRQAGHDAESLPLIEIGPPLDQTQLLAQRCHWSDYDALMFVSAQAVRGFVTPDTDWTDGRTRFWAPGPGTARALLEAGVPAQRIDQPAPDAQQFDSESLWAEVKHQVGAGHRLLLVRGRSVGMAENAQPDTAATLQGNGREWLTQQCRDRGGQVEACAAYERRAPRWDESTRVQAQHWLKDGSIWLISSSEALEYLRQLCPDADFSRARALATHPRIRQACNEMGVGTVIESRPALPDVLKRLESV